MRTDSPADFAGLLLANLADATFFFVLGALAGAAFPLGLLCRRALTRAAAIADRRAQARRRVVYAALLLACAALPWAVLWIGRWHDGAPIETMHAVALIAGSAASITYLLRRWRLRGD